MVNCMVHLVRTTIQTRFMRIENEFCEIEILRAKGWERTKAPNGRTQNENRAEAEKHTRRERKRAANIVEQMNERWMLCINMVCAKMLFVHTTPPCTNSSIRELVIINFVWANRYMNTEYIIKRAQHFALSNFQLTLVLFGASIDLADFMYARERYSVFCWRRLQIFLIDWYMYAANVCKFSRHTFAYYFATFLYIFPYCFVVNVYIFFPLPMQRERERETGACQWQEEIFIKCFVWFCWVIAQHCHAAMAFIETLSQRRKFNTKYAERHSRNIERCTLFIDKYVGSLVAQKLWHDRRQAQKKQTNEQASE